MCDLLIESDIRTKDAFEISETLRNFCKKTSIHESQKIIDELKKIMSNYIKEIDLNIDTSKVNVLIFLGTNGVGKTTSVAKLANYFAKKFGKEKVVLAAADTFRAAAIEQLQFHASKLNLRVISHQHGSDPGAVVFDAIEAVKAKGGGIVLADTAGRMHNKENLVKELKKISKIAETKTGEDCCKKILVIDGTTGQNALSQLEAFSEAVKVDAVFLTKYDASSKGGAVISIGKQYGLPVCFLGTGEQYENIEVFSKDKYIADFFE